MNRWYTGSGLRTLNGDPLPAELLDDRAVLFVNVASQCGHTPQYAGLQQLWQAWRDRGLTVVGVPCNQFGAQEPGGPEEISAFCSRTYQVDFPLLEKQDVNGPNRSALYQHLVDSAVGAGVDIRWNFEKFLVNRQGEVTWRGRSSVKPDDDALRDAIASVLGL